MKTKHYDEMTSNEKISVLTELYHGEMLSWVEVAKQLDITPDKARKQAKKLGIKSRNKSEAQKVALEAGRSEHRTEGRERTQEEKEKISNSIGAIWDSLSEEEKEERRQWSRDAWNNKTEQEKQFMLEQSRSALHRTSRLGSKLEWFLFSELTKKGYAVDLHKTHLLRNRNLTIDLLIPKLSTAIEVDGPNHFEPIHGEENLQKTRVSDQQKTGLILAENLCLIRIKQKQKLSQRYQRNVLSKLLNILNSIENLFPSDASNRYFEI